MCPSARRARDDCGHQAMVLGSGGASDDRAARSGWHHGFMVKVTLPSLRNKDLNRGYTYTDGDLRVVPRIK